MCMWGAFPSIPGTACATSGCLFWVLRIETFAARLGAVLRVSEDFSGSEMVVTETHEGSSLAATNLICWRGQGTSAKVYTSANTLEPLEFFFFGFSGISRQSKPHQNWLLSVLTPLKPIFKHLQGKIRQLKPFFRLIHSCWCMCWRSLVSFILLLMQESVSVHSAVLDQIMGMLPPWFWLLPKENGVLAPRKLRTGVLWHAKKRGWLVG